LRKRATTRKIANIFTEIREKVVEKRENISMRQQTPSIKEETLDEKTAPTLPIPASPI
jgi:hypothetical protein